MMNLCKVDSGYKLGCSWQGVGGIKRLYMMPFEYVQTLSYFYNENNQISLVSQIGGNKYYEFELIPNSAIVNQKYVKDDKTGLYYFEQKIEVQFNKPNYILTNQAIKLLNTRLFSVITMDNNGRYFLHGKDYGMFVEEESETSGQKFPDWNGQKFVLMAKEPSRRQEVLSTAFIVSSIRTSTPYTGGGVSVPVEPAIG